MAIEERYKTRKVWRNGEGYVFIVADTVNVDQKGNEAQVGLGFASDAAAKDMAMRLNRMER